MAASKYDWPKELARAQREGVHAAELARQLGCSAYTVCKHRMRLGVELPQKQKWTTAKADWPVVLASAKRAGMSIGDVARNVGVSKPAVLKHCRKLGVVLKGQKPREQGRDAA